MTVSTALLISDDPTLFEAVHEVIEAVPGLLLDLVADVATATTRLRSGGVVLLLPHRTGADSTATVAGLLREVAVAKLPVATVVLSEHRRPADTLALLRQGAADVLDRPLDLARLTYLCDTLTVRARLLARVAPHPHPAPLGITALGEGEPFFYGSSGDLGVLVEQVRRVAPQETTLLLGGETGTGKTRLARLVHELSRKGEPFTVANCGALSGSLMESELFGHVRGAFTGADRDRTGRFADAGRGTLLLDDIDALPLQLQTKLLRAVEDRVFEPVGSNRLQPLQARLIVASNRDLEEESAAGRFRLDLFYRLNVVAFHLPPLRERRQVIPAVAHHFAAELARRCGRPLQGLVPRAVAALQAYNWPGNLRELRNAIERAVALCAGPQIQIEDLPAAVQKTEAADVPVEAAEAAPPTLSRAKEAAEAERIAEALRRNNNNRLRAAAELGICRMTLYKKLHRYGLLSTSCAEQSSGGDL